jgi:hypothetical protein
MMTRGSYRDHGVNQIARPSAAKAFDGAELLVSTRVTER